MRDEKLSGQRLSWEAMMSLEAEELSDHSLIPPRIFDQTVDMFEHLARMIADFIKERNLQGLKTVIIIPVGPTRHLSRLVEIINTERISLRNCIFFNMDEWMSWDCRLLPVDHGWSLRGYLQRNFWGLIDVDLQPLPENLAYPTPKNMDNYSEKLDELGGADLCYGGFGFSGHIANNEPPQSRWWNLTLDDMRHSRTRMLPLNDETLIAFSHRASGGNTKAIPPMAVTIGMHDILNARKLVLVSDGGAWKQHTLRILLMHEPTIMFPCTLAQEHPDCEVWVDAKTARSPKGDIGTQAAM